MGGGCRCGGHETSRQLRLSRPAPATAEDQADEPADRIAAGLLLGGCGGGSTTTAPSPGKNTPLGTQKDNPTQEHLAKDNPTQVPLSGEKDGKAAGR